MGIVTRKNLEERARELSAGQVMLETVVGAMLAARTTLQTERTKLHNPCQRSCAMTMSAVA